MIKAGDYVKVLDGSNIKDYKGGWAIGMDDFVGGVFQVENVYNNGSCHLKGLPYCFDARGLAQVSLFKDYIVKTSCMRGARHSYMVENIYVNRDKRITVVEFEDGTKVKVKCGEDEKFDVYTAVTAAISEKIYGSNSALKRAIAEKTIDQKPKKKVGKVSVELECSHVEDATSVLQEKIDNAMNDIKKMLEKNIKVK